MDNSYQERLDREEKERLKRQYKERGFQQQSLNEYLTMQKLQKKKFRIPPGLKFFLTTPFILLFCLGVIFIPYMFFLLLSSFQQ